MKSLPLVILVFAYCVIANGQVKTNFSNFDPINSSGRYNKNYRGKGPYVISPQNIKALLAEDSLQNLTDDTRPYKIAKALPVNIDVVKEAEWLIEGKTAYGLFSLVATSARSVSVNFDDFYLPEGTEMYIYSENGEMITGPVTELENNGNSFWGSWVYKGPKLTIEVKILAETMPLLKLHLSSIGYGYKNIYRQEVGRFGESASCNINVLCPLGNGWENERNSVALILDASSEALCTGALVNNTCNLTIPYLLTANHCFNTTPQQNVAQWKFTFQAWSSTCTPSQNSQGLTFNSSVLRANSAGSDFCLVELSQTPPANSGIMLSGWSRNTIGITSTTIIHHPMGDVMKISRDDQAPFFENFLSAQCWHLTLDQGATEGGSSGSPYFDQNHRIIGQHYGVSDNNLPVCDRINKFGGRFDISWTGGGTNATRLSNWLDPGNTGAMTTNSRILAAPSISGASIICTSQTYQINNLPPGTNVNWSTTWNGAPYPTLVQNSPSVNQCTISNTYRYPSTTTLTATISGSPCGNIVLTRQIMSESNTQVQYGTYTQEACWVNNQYQPALSGSLPSTTQTPVYLHQGCMAQITLRDMVGKTVTSTGSTPQYWYYNSSTNVLSLQLPLYSGGLAFSFKISGAGACYDKTLLFFSYLSSPSQTLVASPNPVSTELNVAPTDPEVQGSFEATLVDGSGAVLRGPVTSVDGKNIKLDVRGLKKGQYFLQLNQGGKVSVEHILIE